MIINRLRGRTINIDRCEPVRCCVAIEAQRCRERRGEVLRRMPVHRERLGIAMISIRAIIPGPESNVHFKCLLVTWPQPQQCDLTRYDKVC